MSSKEKGILFMASDKELLKVLSKKIDDMSLKMENL